MGTPCRPHHNYSYLIQGQLNSQCHVSVCVLVGYFANVQMQLILTSKIRFS